MRIEPDLDLARDLFSELHGLSHDGVGITRDAYGDGEQRAHDLLATAARALDLEIETDAALNLYVTLPGRDRGAAASMTGSHIDSVPRGGNFDGAVGVLAGLSVLSGWRKANFVPSVDTTLMVIRAEESSWFPISYIGSKAAFGKLPKEALDQPRTDTGRSLAEHISAIGGKPDQVANGVAKLDPARISRFVEVHIEQGPVLIEAGEAVGLVTGIRGSFRFRRGRACGAYAHSGATPRTHRKDAVLAVAHLVTAMNKAWIEHEADGRDLTVTFGRFETDPAQADFSKVAGTVDFSVDVRSSEPETLRIMEEHLLDFAREISVQSGVSIELGARTSSEPATMDPVLRAAIKDQAQELGTTIREMSCGAGHDAAFFASQGVPSAMIFVRNANGSHNPREALEFDDFADATRLLERALALP